jgi:putative transposase
VLYLVLRRILQRVMLCGRDERAKEIEIVVLWHQVWVLRRQVARPDLNDGDRGRAGRAVAVTTPVIVEQFLCHLGDAAALALAADRLEVEYPRARPGRASTRADIGEAVLGLTRENATWG